MRPPTNIDPELRVLLQEVAADPQARLFRIEIPRPERLLLSGAEPANPTTTGLTSAERQILRVHREEVAQILRDAAEWRIQQDPIGKVRVSPYITLNCRRGFPERDELMGKLRSRTRWMRRSHATDASIEAGVRACSRLDARHVSAYELAGASLRIVPHDAGWIQLARGLELEGESGTAGKVTMSVLKNNPASPCRASALSFLGVLCELRGRPADAAACFASAAIGGSVAPNILLSWFVESILAGDRAQTKEAAARIDPYIPLGAEALTHWIAQMKRRLELTPLPAPSEAARRVAFSISGYIGPSAQLVLDALPIPEPRARALVSFHSIAPVGGTNMSGRGPSIAYDPPHSTCASLSERDARRVS